MLLRIPSRNSGERECSKGARASAPPVRGYGRARMRGASDESGTGPEASVGGEGQERDVPRARDGEGELALVLGAGAAHPRGQDLAPRGHEPREQLHVLVVDVV